ncbi:DUF1365 domain-containing protein [Pelagibacteraceae bacterium]|nr:DUF1365 domain-containing protein [Pelagibacteraceae bacterium]
MNSCIYNGVVKHQRFKPIKHSLSYKTFSLLVDLDEIETLANNISIFSLNKFNIFSFYNLDHGVRDGSSIKDWVLKNIKKFNISNNITKIKLLCYPRIFGYVFNPLSIFYCYENNDLRAIFYEVKNTFNEQHTYIFKIKNNKKIEQKCKKKFYVSPFLDMETYYNFKLLNPKDKLSIFIKQTDGEETILTATQTGEKKEFSFKQLLINFFKYPLMTIKIISSIHYEAFFLWKKGAVYRKRTKKVLNNLSYEEY